MLLTAAATLCVIRNHSIAVAGAYVLMEVVFVVVATMRAKDGCSLWLGPRWLSFFDVAPTGCRARNARLCRP